MSTYAAAADRTAVIAAARATGYPDERVANALLAWPPVATVWDAGVAPTVPADMKWAFRRALNAAGINDERADALYAKVATGISAVATIPTVTGTQFAAAEKALRDRGLRVGTKTFVVNAAPAGQVTVQAPTAGASQVGTPVNLTISLGP